MFAKTCLFLCLLQKNVWLLADEEIILSFLADWSRWPRDTALSNKQIENLYLENGVQSVVHGICGVRCAVLIFVDDSLTRIKAHQHFNLSMFNVRRCCFHIQTVFPWLIQTKQSRCTLFFGRIVDLSRILMISYVFQTTSYITQNIVWSILDIFLFYQFISTHTQHKRIVT